MYNLIVNFILPKNMFITKFLSLLIGLLVYSMLASSIEAVNTPSFPACSNPQGSVKADYPSGTHGIVGSTATYTGSDKVYQVDSEKVMQCFCASTGGSGIQTNWWKIPNLSESEINIFKSQGWIYVPNGALWGLDEAPYLAINTNYSCSSSNGNNNSSNSGSSQGSVAGAAANAVGDVLGLASTGNNTFFYLTFITGVLSLLIGFILRKKASR